MAIEVQTPSGAVIEFPDGTPAETIRTTVQRASGHNPLSWDEVATGVGRQLMQGASFSFADEGEAAVPFLRQPGEDYNAAVTRIRRENERFSKAYPVASFAANVAGGVPLFAAGGPLAGAAGWVGNAPTLTAAVGRSAALGSGVGATSGFGAGEGGIAERLPSAGRGALVGAGVGAAAPPIVAGATRALEFASRAVAPRSALGARASEMPPGEPPFYPASAPEPQGPPMAGGQPPRSPPVSGVTFVDSRTEDAINAQDRAIRLIADQLVRAGRAPAEAEAMLSRVGDATRLNTNSYAQDATALADLFPELQRLAGSAARSYPEAANDIAQFVAARQTGMTPQGANAVALAERGIPTRQRFSQRMTGTEAGERLGQKFVAQPDETFVPMGNRERVMDAMKRALTIKDSDFHGHAATPGRTEEQILLAAKAEAQTAYRDAYAANAKVNIGRAVEPILQQWEQRAAQLPPAFGNEIRRMVRQFRTTNGQPITDLRTFQRAKEVADDRIEKLLTRESLRNQAGLVIELKNDLLGAVDNATGGANSLYAQARAQFSDRMRARDILNTFRDAWKGESTAGIDAYAALGSEGERKLARLGLLWGFEGQTAGTDFGRNVANVFNNPRVNELLANIGPRSEKAGAVFADRPERLGQYLDQQNAMARTRDTVLGGSQTAKNIQDDLALNALEAFQDMRGAMNAMRGSASLWEFGSRVLERIIDRSFGMSADTARELSRMLFTANPTERLAVLRRVAAAMPKDRMTRFNELMRTYAQGVGAGAAGAGSLAGQQGPINF